MRIPRSCNLRSIEEIIQTHLPQPWAWDLIEKFKIRKTQNQRKLEENMGNLEKREREKERETVD